MEYDISYQLSMDIDWFFVYKGVYFHVASNGHKLPSLEDFKVHQEENVLVQRKTERLIQSNNNSYEEIVTRENPRNLNHSTFIEFARLGFVSLDTINDNEESSILQVIARPIKYWPPQKQINVNDLNIGSLNILLAGIRIFDINGEQLILE